MLRRDLNSRRLLLTDPVRRPTMFALVVKAGDAAVSIGAHDNVGGINALIQAHLDGYLAGAKLLPPGDVEYCLFWRI